MQYFFYLRKAFDVVDHHLLLEKLAAYKFSPSSQSCIQSYFTNRKQCIVNQNTRSSLQLIKSGVPQGSVLGSRLPFTQELILTSVIHFANIV